MDTESLVMAEAYASFSPICASSDLCNSREQISLGLGYLCRKIFHRRGRRGRNSPTPTSQLSNSNVER
jgi:hypothetical protein